jgi:hypothetical protein
MEGNLFTWMLERWAGTPLGELYSTYEEWLLLYGSLLFIVNVATLAFLVKYTYIYFLVKSFG